LYLYLLLTFGKLCIDFSVHSVDDSVRSLQYGQRYQVTEWWLVVFTLIWWQN